MVGINVHNYSLADLYIGSVEGTYVKKEKLKETLNAFDFIKFEMSPKRNLYLDNTKEMISVLVNQYLDLFLYDIKSNLLDHPKWEGLAL